MRIKFIAPDPRAGSVAQMDSSRGQALVNSGSAEQIKDDQSEDAKQEDVKESVAAVATAPVKTTQQRASKGKK